MRLYNVNRSRKDNDGASGANVILLRKEYDHTRKDNLCSNYAKLVSVSNTLRQLPMTRLWSLLLSLLYPCGDGSILTSRLELMRN
jgi:hypothetical protein